MLAGFGCAPLGRISWSNSLSAFGGPFSVPDQTSCLGTLCLGGLCLTCCIEI